MSIINILKNKDTLLSLFLSIIHYTFNKFIIILLNSIDDYYLFFITNKIQYNNSINSDSESDSESESDLDSESETEITKNKNLDYVQILELFNMANNKNNLNNLTLINNINKNELFIVNAFLFNYNNNKLISDLIDIYPFTKKLVILQKLHKKINTNQIKQLNLNYRFMYILYQNHKSSYKILMIDLNNNFNILNNKKLLFNNIKL